VVTAKTQYSLKSAKNYFHEHLSVGDYYQEGQKTSGEWFGVGAEKLGLSRRVAAEDFLALCDNRHPQTGNRLTQRLMSVRWSGDKQAPSRRVFYDFTFSPPKSVSILALVAKDERIIDAHHRALNVALVEFEQFGATRIRRNRSNDLRVTQNIVAALFTHDTSRALDPHLHTHCIVFNATYDPEEDRWKALQNYEMLKARKFVENVYYHELAKDLRRFGYGIRNLHRGDFQVDGVGDEICERFSKRHEQIDDSLRDLLEKKPELTRGNLNDLRERLATAERSRKMHDIPRSQLEELWNVQLSRSELESLKSLARPSVAESETLEERAAEEALTWAEEHLFDRQSVVPEFQLWRVALERARGRRITLDLLKRLTAERDYVREPTVPVQVTTKTVLARELEIVASAKEGVSRCAPLLARELSPNRALDDEQMAALARLGQSRDFITVFRGGAGTGKSFVLRELVSCLQQRGAAVTVLAPQRQQVIDLTREEFPSPTTVADFLLRKDLKDHGIVVVDEAGQIGARQMLELILTVSARKGRLVLSGDTRQHGPVEASDALVALERYAGLKPVELERIRRQDPNLARTRKEREQITAYRRAVGFAAAGRLYRSFLELDRMRAVVVCRMNDQPDVLTEEYLRLAGQGHSTVVVSQTWTEVHRVNERVRAALKEKGLLGIEDRLIDALEKVDLTPAEKRDARSYGPGRVIVFNQRIQKFEAGTVAQFVEVLDKGIVAEVQDKLVVVRQRNLDRINVCRPLTLPLASGDRLQLKANRKLPGGSIVTNGELVTVRQVRGDGAIELIDGRVLDAGYREFVPGYAVTSYGSQGRTVDYVLFSDSTIKAATNDQQWYVTISRGRRGIRIFTPDKEQLRENVLRSGQRRLALELSGFARRSTDFRWADALLRRFGERITSLIHRARRFHQFNHDLEHHYEHKTT